MPAIRADLAAIEDARHCAAVANAVLAAFDHDRLFAGQALVFGHMCILGWVVVFVGVRVFEVRIGIEFVEQRDGGLDRGQEMGAGRGRIEPFRRGCAMGVDSHSSAPLTLWSEPAARLLPLPRLAFIATLN